MTKLDDCILPPGSRRRYLRMVLYGPPGVGKTKLACELGERPLLIACEPGDETLADWPELDARTTVMRYGGVNQLNALHKAMVDGTYDFDTIIIDTIDELVEKMLDDLLKGYQLSKATRPVAEPKPGTGLKRIELTGTDDYHLLRNGIRPGIRDLCSLPVNLILTSHVREPSWADEERKSRHGIPIPPLRPDLPDKTYKMLKRYVGLIGHMTRKGDKRQIAFLANNKEESKSRIRELDGQVVDAELFPSLIESWRNK